MDVLEKIRADLPLSEGRMRHTEGVVKAALTLAERHFPFLPEDDVRKAALMHDYTKEYDVERQLALCETYGLAVSEEEKAAPKLLHARTAAAVAEQEYRLSPSVCAAVRWHTTGRPGMEPLEIVIYFADYIEENRTFPSCIRLRRYYERQLEKRKTASEALLYGLAKSFDLTLLTLIDEKGLIDRMTVEARNYYRMLIKKGNTEDLWKK